MIPFTAIILFISLYIYNHLSINIITLKFYFVILQVKFLLHNYFRR